MSSYHHKPNFLDAKVDANGVVRWKSNNRVPPQDVLVEWENAGFDFDIEASRKVREKEFAAFAREYRKNYKGPSAEEISEMRAAFGHGVTVVNALTGTKTKL